MKIELWDFIAKVVTENIFNPTVWYESLHLNNNDNGVRTVKFATSNI